MNNKLLMEGILWDTKVLADLCLHGTIESSSKDVHKEFIEALKDILVMQNEIFTYMSSAGFYQVEQVEKSKIAETKNKFDPTCDCQEA